MAIHGDFDQQIYVYGACGDRKSYRYGLRFVLNQSEQDPHARFAGRLEHKSKYSNSERKTRRPCITVYLRVVVTIDHTLTV